MIGRISRVLPILFFTLPAEVSSRCALVRLYDYRDKYLVVDLRRDRARELTRSCSSRPAVAISPAAREEIDRPFVMLFLVFLFLFAI